MPLDGHSYLVAQGWTGSGTGLRQGAISRPLAIPQKKTLAGVGKDRDEAFPFWDHLFSAASKSIQIKISNDDSDASDSEEPVEAAISLKRTTTGILSNRRPVTGPSAESSSGTATPDSDTPQLSLLATAKRDAARRMLYAQFFRGPVLGPDSPVPASTHKPIDASPSTPVASGEEPQEKKRRKLAGEKDEDKAARRERKRLKREKKELKELKRAEKKSKKEKAEESSVTVISEKKKKRRRDEEEEEETVKQKKSEAEEKSERDTSKRKRKRDEEGSEEQRRRKRKATELNKPG